MKRVLVTRPEPAASETANVLRERSFEPVILPLSRIAALPLTHDLPDCDVIAITSTNALRDIPADALSHLLDRPCFTVGAKTASAARAIGFTHVESADGDATLLAARIITRCRKGDRITYLTGRVRLPDFERMLLQAGFGVAVVETYDTYLRTPSTFEFEALRTGRPIDAALIYSAKAADAMQSMTARPELAETFWHTVHCCLSERIAMRLEGIEPQQIRVAVRPEEAAILDLLND